HGRGQLRVTTPCAGVLTRRATLRRRPRFDQRHLPQPREGVRADGHEEERPSAGRQHRARGALMPSLRWGSATDPGRVRSNNQDGRVASERLFAVADGMGGHRGGEVASQIALTVLEANFAEPNVDALHDAARDANDAIYQRSEEDADLRGMGTTLVV